MLKLPDLNLKYPGAAGVHHTLVDNHSFAVNKMHLFQHGKNTKQTKIRKHKKNLVLGCAVPELKYTHQEILLNQMKIFACALRLPIPGCLT